MFIINDLQVVALNPILLYQMDRPILLIDNYSILINPILPPSYGEKRGIFLPNSLESSLIAILQILDDIVTVKQFTNII